MKPFNIVLVEPQIPQNTGNIARTCAATNSVLHLVGPLGFQITDAKLKRAGLDYWHLLDIRYYNNITEFFEKNTGGQFFYTSTKARNIYSDIQYPEGAYIFFGKETAGLDEALLKANPSAAVRIPMLADARSLNLSNTVAVLIYEALRQHNFGDLKTQGQLTKYEW